jgi:succinate semialdehyde reductase
LVAHKFNKSIFYKRFQSIVKKLNFKKISLNLDLDLASELILKDKKHLDNNPTPITKNEIINLLKETNLNH